MALPSDSAISEDIFDYEGDESTGITIKGLKDKNAGLTEIYIPDTIDGIPVVRIEERAFSSPDLDAPYTKIVLPKGLKSIGKNAFYGCSSLTDINLPDSLECIEKQAFYGCSSLESIEIPDSVTYIGGYVFAYCDGLTELKMPADAYVEDYIFSIREDWMYLMPDRTKITVGDCTYYYIGDYMDALEQQLVQQWANAEIESGTAYEPASETAYDFTDDANAKIFEFEDNGDGIVITGVKDKGTAEVVIPDTINGKTVVGIHWTFGECHNLTSITIPDGVTFIGAYAFLDCSSLTDIVIPDSVESIGECAFAGCTSLKNVKLPSNLTGIESAMFIGCSSLESIEIPAGVTRIYVRTFQECSSLTNVKFTGSADIVGIWSQDDAYAHGGTDCILFEGCDNLSNIVWGENTYTGLSEFYGAGQGVITCWEAY